MNNPTDLKYTKSHEWILFTDEKTARIGLTDYAQNSLGDIVFINLPEIDDELEAGESLGEVESVKAVSDIISPVTGVVSAVNEQLEDSPEQVNSDPCGSWLVEIGEISKQEELMDASDYETFCAQEG